MAKLAWKPWHKVVELREDLKTGELPIHIFAADLYEVVMQRKERPVYFDRHGGGGIPAGAVSGDRRFSGSKSDNSRL